MSHTTEVITERENDTMCGIVLLNYLLFFCGRKRPKKYSQLLWNYAKGLNRLIYLKNEISLLPCPQRLKCSTSNS